MPAIREDQVLSSSSEEVEDPSPSSGERWRRRESSTSLLDKVVKENRVYGTVSPYGDSFDEEQEEEWTVLASHDKDEATPLIHQKTPFISSLRRNVEPTMCFLAMVTFIMAMLVCTIWVIPGVFTHTVVVAPNETVMAAYEVDPLVTANIVYKVTSTTKEEEEEEEREQLTFYREKCNNIDRFSTELDVSDHLDIPADTSRMEISRLYLAADSSIQYTVNLTRPATVKESPSRCYASIHRFEDYLSLRSFLSSSDTTGADYSYEFCGNVTNDSFRLDAKKSSYSFLALSLATASQVGSVSLSVSGMVFYYNSTLHDDNLVCTLTPPINYTCEIPVSDESDQAKLCVLITRGVPHAPGKASIMVATGNHNALASTANVNKDDDIIQLEQRRTTFWGINQVYVFACLFVPILMSSCVLAILSPRRANYGAYIRSGRKKMVN